MAWRCACVQAQAMNGYGGGLVSCSFRSGFPTLFKRGGLRRYEDASVVGSRINGQAFRIVATSNAIPGNGNRLAHNLASLALSSSEALCWLDTTVSPGDKNSGKQIIMVDPLEAKRLAAKQLQEIKAKEKFKRRRQIEAINGAWAMIGLTAGLVIEGQTGKGILAQLAGYFFAIVNFFVR